MSILKALFGPSRKEIWTQLSNEIGATYNEGGTWKNDEVRAKHKEWMIILDKYVVSSGKSSITYTRMRAPFINKDKFRFTIYRRSWFSDVGKWLGLVSDVEVDQEDFDSNYIIQGNDHYKLWKFFNNEHIRMLISHQPEIYITVNKANAHVFDNTYPDNVDCVTFMVVGVIKDINRLKLLFDLFAEILDHLCHIGTAYEDDPTLKNYYI
jgi:hypothetical protein